MRDDDLINNPAIHLAVQAHRATLTDATYARSHRNPIGLVLVAIGVISLVVCVLSGLIHLAG